MEIITDLNELARDELMKKYKESFLNRIVELETAVDKNDKKVAELTEKYMNEINLRKNAETTAEDANFKVEELQNTLDSFQQRTHTLEREMEAYKLAMQERDLQPSDGSLSEELGDEAKQEEVPNFLPISFDEDIFEEVVDAEHEEATRQEKLREEFLKQVDRAVHEQALQLTRCSLSDAVLNKQEDPSNRECQHSLSLEVLTEKLSQERENSFSLEDKVAELERRFHELCELKDSIVEEAENQEEWFKTLLTREREQNERLSKESDRTIEELLEKLKDAREVNSQLMKWKDEVCNSSNFYEETEQKYKEIITHYEMELQEAKSGLSDIRAELLALRSEQKRSWEEDMENDIEFASTPQKQKPSPLESEVSLSDEIREEVENEIFISTPQKSKQSPVDSEVSFSEEIHQEEKENEEETPVMKYGNQKYRVKLAELIWNGMRNLLNV